MKKYILTTFVIFFAGLFSACKKDPSTSPAPVNNIPVSGDYFPMDSNFTSIYLYENFNDSTFYSYDTNTFIFKNNQSYIETNDSFSLASSENTFLYTSARKENGNYYGKDAFGHEVLFLKDYLPPGSSWIEYIKDSLVYKKFIIESVNSEVEVKNVLYKNVIHISEELHSDPLSNPDLFIEIHHYYAKGIGEVYAIFPRYSATYVNTKISLLSYKAH